MRQAVAVLVLLAVVVACGRDDAAVPALRIVSLSATDRAAEVVFIAEDEGGAPVDATIDWGDRSPLERLAGSGELSASHEYTDDVEAPVVIIEVVNESGQSVRTARTLELATAPTSSPTPTSSTSTTITPPSTSTTSTVPPTTTTTTTTEPPVTTSTTTTSPPTTTTTTTTSNTTTIPTTTTSTTTTTAATSTLPPEAFERVVHLSFDDSDNDHLTDGTDSESDVVDGDEVHLLARTVGNQDDAYAAVVATWSIPHSEFDQLGDAPSVRVLIEASTDLVMSTGKNKGRAALYSFDIRGTSGGDVIGTGSSTTRTIDRNDDFDDVVDDTVGFGGRLESGSADAIVIQLTVECSAFGGTTFAQVGEESVCEAEFRARELRVRIART